MYIFVYTSTYVLAIVLGYLRGSVLDIISVLTSIIK